MLLDSNIIDIYGCLDIIPSKRHRAMWVTAPQRKSISRTRRVGVPESNELPDWGHVSGAQRRGMLSEPRAALVRGAQIDGGPASTNQIGIVE
jgi:hypothetical protein